MHRGTDVATRLKPAVQARGGKPLGCFGVSADERVPKCPVHDGWDLGWIQRLDVLLTLSETSSNAPQDPKDIAADEAHQLGIFQFKGIHVADGRLVQKL